MIVKNIYCVGRNYKLHAEELGNAVPTKPMIFSKPTHALTNADGQTLILPNDKGALHYEVELVVQINKKYEEGMKAKDCINQIAIGIDFTLRDIQDELKRKGHPWLLAKGFPNSAVVTPFFSIANIEALDDASFSLEINGKTVQLGKPKEMIFSLDRIISYCGEHFGLGNGDIIFTGTPAGVGAVSSKDHFKLLFGEQIKGEFSITLQ